MSRIASLSTRGKRLVARLSGHGTTHINLAELASLREARQLARETENRDLALNAYRAALVDSDHHERVALEFARFLTGASLGRYAEEVVAESLAKNGAQPNALEIFGELVREFDLPQSRLSWALQLLARDIAAHPRAHLGALDFAIPHGMSEILETVSRGNNAEAKVAAQLALGRLSNIDTGTARSGSLEATATETRRPRAELVVALGLDDLDWLASLTQKVTTDDLPMDSLRRAIRRARADKRHKHLATYLDLYLQKSPEDSWAKGIKRDLTYGNDALIETGFPFPPIAAENAYEANPKSVLYLVHNSLPHHSAGYATRTQGILTELRRLGWDANAASRLGYPLDFPGMENLPEIPNAEQVGDVSYYRLLRGREVFRKNPLYFYVHNYSDFVVDLAQELKPSIVHAASNHVNGLAAVMAARKLGIPSIYEVRGLWEITRISREPDWEHSDTFKLWAAMEAEAAKGATKVITLTNALKEEMIRRGVEGSKITVVPNGVDSSRFAPLSRDKELAAHLGIEHKTVIGYVGSVLDYEGLDLLIEAAHQLSRERHDFHVLIVGDGAQLEALRELVTSKNLGHLVTFTGRVPHEDVERYYSLIDIAPFPRLPLPVCEMVSPLKPFEAMAMGKTVVASDVAALAEFVHPGHNGLLHVKGSASSLAEQLRIALDDREFREQLGQQARAWVIKERDWHALATEITSLYTSLGGA